MRDKTPDVGARGGFYRADQVVGRVVQELPEAELGFGDDRDRAGGERCHRGLRAFLRQRRANDDRRGPLMHDLLEKSDPVHARHLDIEHDHVGPLAFHPLHGEKGVGRGADHFDAGIGIEQAGQYLAHHCRVVHHHDFDAIHADSLDSSGSAAMGSIWRAQTSPLATSKMICRWPTPNRLSETMGMP